MTYRCCKTRVRGLSSERVVGRVVLQKRSWWEGNFSLAKEFWTLLFECDGARAFVPLETWQGCADQLVQGWCIFSWAAPLRRHGNKKEEASSFELVTFWSYLTNPSPFPPRFASGNFRFWRLPLIRNPYFLAAAKSIQDTQRDPRKRFPFGGFGGKGYRMLLTETLMIVELG